VKRLFSLAGVAGVIGVMLWAAAAAGAATVPAQASSIAWGACSDPNLKAFNAQCGYLSVPLDYNDPNGPQIQLAVSRIQHTSSNYQGVILQNPGGPGGSGLNLTAFVSQQFVAEGYGNMVSDYD
jgi:hypothetical protein